MPTPRTPYEAVLNAARDVAKLDCAFDAELLGTTLLGSVYAVAEDDRAAAVQAFVGNFLTATTRRRTPAATVIRQVFATLVPDAAGVAELAEAGQPSWLGYLGQVRLTGSYAYGDVYGDQTSYVATFAYEDDDVGGPEHAVVALIDHNIGVVKDLFVGGPANVVVDQIREMCEADGQTWFDDKVEPERLHDEVIRHLVITDSMGSLPGEGSLATDRTLAGARLALLPRGESAEPEPLNTAARAALETEFLAAAEATRAGLGTLDEERRLARDFSIKLILDHAETFPDADPLRWSPVMAELFMLDWVHRRAVLDDADALMLPRVLRAWVAYAARRRGAPAVAAERTVAAVDELAPEFARLHASGERRSTAAQALAELMADGVDPEDSGAVTQWLRANGKGPR